jgi:hypothetical protein
MTAKDTMVCLAGFALLIGSASAEVLFSDSVESPTVTGLSASDIPSAWLQSAQGYGATNRVLANEDTLDFTTPFGNQALETHFNSNAGWTTASGAIGSLVEGVTYTLTLNVAANTGDTVNFTVALLAFDPAQVIRDDVRGGMMESNNAVLLGPLIYSGQANTDDMSQTVTINYTASADVAGKDLAIRVRSKGARDRAKPPLPVYFDNFKLSSGVVPESTTNVVIPKPITKGAVQESNSNALIGIGGLTLILR